KISLPRWEPLPGSPNTPADRELPSADGSLRPYRLHPSLQSQRPKEYPFYTFHTAKYSVWTGIYPVSLYIPLLRFLWTDRPLIKRRRSRYAATPAAARLSVCGLPLRPAPVPAAVRSHQISRPRQ